MHAASFTFAAFALLDGCTPPPGEDPFLLFDRVRLESTPSKPTDDTHGASRVLDAIRRSWAVGGQGAIPLGVAEGAAA